MMGISIGGTDISSVSLGGTDVTEISLGSLVVWSAEQPHGDKSLAYTGAVQTWIVPDKVTEILAECWGAQGGSSQNGTGGKGGYAVGYMTVTPGETLTIPVGGQTGFGGGGTGNGGGASDIRQGGTGLTHRKIVAGGGGSSSNNKDGGAGGGLTGGNGTGTGYGHGGTQSAGGGGTIPGELGQGGGVYATSGGGGGNYGGGGGDYWQGSSGGGGSSLIAGLRDGSTTSGVNSGNGKVTITH